MTAMWPAIRRRNRQSINSQHTSPMVLDDLIAMTEKAQAARKQTCIQCCMAAGCLSSRSAEIKEVLDLCGSRRETACGHTTLYAGLFAGGLRLLGHRDQIIKHHR